MLRSNSSLLDSILPVARLCQAWSRQRVHFSPGATWSSMLPVPVSGCQERVNMRSRHLRRESSEQWATTASKSKCSPRRVPSFSQRHRVTTLATSLESEPGPCPRSPRPLGDAKPPASVERPAASLQSAFSPPFSAKVQRCPAKRGLALVKGESQVTDTAIFRLWRKAVQPRAAWPSSRTSPKSRLLQFSAGGGKLPSQA
jgi:hypothetical protein